MTIPRAFRSVLPAFAACVLSSLSVRAQDVPRNEFEGKYLSVIKKSDPEYITSLEKVSLRKLGNDFFLAGVGADDGDPENWQKGVTIWIAVSDVSEMMVFPSVEKLRERLEETEERTASRPAEVERDEDAVPFAEPGYEEFVQRPGKGWREPASTGRHLEAARQRAILGGAGRSATAAADQFRRMRAPRIR